MAALPWLPLFPADYLADTQHLTTEEHGAYILLLMNYWLRGQALNNKDDRLKYVVKLSTERWADVKRTLSEFFDIQDEIWVHHRVEDDLRKAVEKSTQASRSASMRIKGKGSERSANAERTLNDIDIDIDIDKQNGFDEFWSAYPRKDEKKKARLLYRKIIKTVDAHLLIEGAKRYASEPYRKKAYTKLPTTWLNGENWNDTPLPSPDERFVITTPTPIPPRVEPEPEIVRSPEELAHIAEIQAGIRRTLEEKRRENSYKKEGESGHENS